MIAVGLAFAVALVLVEVFALWFLDRRTVRREAQFWEDLRTEALEGYGQVFE